MTKVDRMIALLWSVEKKNTADIAKIMGMQEHEVDRRRPAHLAFLLRMHQRIEGQAHAGHHSSESA